MVSRELFKPGMILANPQGRQRRIENVGSRVTFLTREPYESDWHYRVGWCSPANLEKWADRIVTEPADRSLAEVLVAELRRLEWGVMIPLTDAVAVRGCPVCRMSRELGHTEFCTLADALRQASR